eukprot:CAMPEP_0180421162 /NCGR_PEP_ID=MMETSP1036_2-20121128/3007_1 /TAXON_ID=632150 /ORGANISM="Azadinium spinosum, Strain 3D9" /LENGTH=213 /DNA_ID=CAMNT_0022426415 /DNA_START=198 /DNA_END=836 /DNA_ORIENTATION=+
MKLISSSQLQRQLLAKQHAMQIQKKVFWTSFRNGAVKPMWHIGEGSRVPAPELVPRLISRASSSVVLGSCSTALQIGHPLVSKNLTSTGQKIFSRYRALHKAYPYALGFAVCFTKGIIADTLAQKAIARREKVDGRQVLAMGLFSGCFTGCAYHFIFNVAFSRLWGASKSLSTVISKAATDGILVFPFLYMPTFYYFDELIRHGSLKAIPERW